MAVCVCPKGKDKERAKLYSLAREFEWRDLNAYTNANANVGADRAANDQRDCNGTRPRSGCRRRSPGLARTGPPERAAPQSAAASMSGPIIPAARQVGAQTGARPDGGAHGITATDSGSTTGARPASQPALKAAVVDILRQRADKRAPQCADKSAI